MQDKCVICYEPLCTELNMCVLNCKHIFHFTCFMKWQNHTCPFCRTDYTYLFPTQEQIYHVTSDWNIFIVIILMIYLLLLIAIVQPTCKLN